MKPILLLFSIFLYFTLSAQNTFRAYVFDEDSHEPLIGATARIDVTEQGGTADESGLVVIENIPNGRITIDFRYIGYKETSGTFIFPLPGNEPLEILMSSEEEELEEVIVTATRGSRTIEDEPTRVEAISGEELEEKGNMKPGDIRMLLNESTGIQTQQTSATSYNSSIRIQGLDGKYTQILKDGFPLYSGFSGGLGLLQIVPLDLQQVEVIKGASSTLYGGGAIAGLVNLVSKSPGNDREVDFMVNGTSALGLDLSGFYSQKFNRIGSTLFASYNSGKAYDPAGIGLTAIPLFQRLTVNPRLFIYVNPRLTLYGGLNTTFETRTGGDIRYIEGDSDSTHSYYEKNNTRRISTQLGLTLQVKDSVRLDLKNSLSYYNRTIKIPGFRFSGLQFSSYTEATLTLNRSNMEWIAGFNIWSEQFKHNFSDSAGNLSYDHLTTGLFIQNTWDITSEFALESGLRADYQNEYGFFLLPRLSLMLRLTPEITIRLGGGLGYKPPTVFTEDAERIQFRNILPVNANDITAEQSSGANLDLNYRVSIGDEATFSINQLFFFTHIEKPLILTETTGDSYEFLQSGGSMSTRGTETNIKFTWHQFKLFTGYTFADVNKSVDGNTSPMTLVAKHRLNNVLMFEMEERLKIGLEGYYFSRQLLGDGNYGKPYWLFGFMIEKLWEGVSVFINFENITDTRQTRFDTIYTGSLTKPEFRDIYAPVEGFLVNGGFKLRL